MHPIPDDYLTRVYAGVLGKLIGVFLGRPFEQWTHQRIMAELGPIEGYVNDRLGQPLVVTDDDVAGTFTFIRALEDHGVSPDLSSADIGRTWLNYLIKERTILWWGGNGISTEHTAWLNLKKGIPAPASGSIATNGQAVAEQIGAQIFIDGWALVAPGQPILAARLAGQAARVSHDGESVHAAQLWAAMEAEAFLSADIDHLLDTGLAQIPPDCLIATLIAEIRAWHRADADWQTTRQRIEDKYGYDKFPGSCHVVPNHALMIIAVLYAPDDFHRAQMIVNTSGWDTDCNAGNVGCLMGIMLGLDALDARYDFRGPIADRMLISSADGGNSVNDAAKMAHYLAGLGHRLAGQPAPEKPKRGAQFHFSLPGSRQGFRAAEDLHPATIANRDHGGIRVLSIAYSGLGTERCCAVMTPTFAPPDVLRMRTYDLMASPLVYPGQILRARVIAPAENRGAVTVRLRLRVYACDDTLTEVLGPPVTLPPGADRVLDWRLPDCDGQPIAEIGLAIAGIDGPTEGTVLLDHLRYDGAPELVLRQPAKTSADAATFWRMSWVNAASHFVTRNTSALRIAQDDGEGMILHGTGEWTDYRVAATVTLHLGEYGGLIARARGLRCHYAARLTRSGAFQLILRRDETVTVLAEAVFPVRLDHPVALSLTLAGDQLTATAGGITLAVRDSTYASGAVGLLVSNGALSADALRIGPVGA